MSENKDGVEIKFGGSERKPGENIVEHASRIARLAEDIMFRFKNKGGDFKIDGKSPGPEMQDGDKQILEQKLATIMSDLTKIKDELGDQDDTQQ